MVPVVDDGSGMSGSNARRLTTDPAVDGWPAWSPDGKTIYYTNDGATAADSDGFSETQEIWRVPATGGTPQRLTDNAEADLQPDVATDGTVVYWEGGEIRTMAADGTGQHRLATIPSDIGFNPRWSPDGSKIAVLQDDASKRALFDPAILEPPTWRSFGSSSWMSRPATPRPSVRGSLRSSTRSPGHRTERPC